MATEKPWGRMDRGKSVPLFGVLAIFLSACGPPVLTNLDGSSGPEHSLVMVQGKRVVLSRVIWDAGLPSEQVIPGGFLGGYMFSVPPGTPVGARCRSSSNSAR